MAGGVVKGVANKVITYAFTVGIIAALVLGLLSTWVTQWEAILTSVLILAGIVVGFFNITPNEARDYILYVTALVIVTSLSKGTLGALTTIGPMLENVLGSIMAFIMPSVIIVGIRSILNLARS
ncbi:MAG: hypothetical protein AABX13_01570 [Nanoarchaeota archaeon]